MRIIFVEPIPPKTRYYNIEAAIKAAIRHPLHAKAKADATKLSGTTIADAYWTGTDHVIRFSNGLLLHVFPAADGVDWAVICEPPPLNEKELERIGAPPVILRWPARSDYLMDRTALAAARIGREVIDLFSNGHGLFVYCRGILIWCFSRVLDAGRGQPILYVYEDD